MQLVRHVGGQLVGCGLRDAVGRIAEVLLRCPEGDIDDEALTLGYHKRRHKLTGHIMRTHAALEHRIPPPTRLEPKGAGPSELSVLYHALIPAPDIVD